MTISQAIEILRYFNAWRRDNEGEMQQPDPKEVGMAIDVVTEYYKQEKGQKKSV